MSQFALVEDLVPAEPPSSDISRARSTLRKHLASGSDAKRMTITVPMAMAMMERNSDNEWSNRPQSSQGLRRFVKNMQRGWVYTGETIIFSESGRLLNGQHRLTAAIEAGTSFECLVAFNVPDDAFKFMDIGTKRSPGAIFAIDGVPNYNQAAAASRVVMSYYQRTDWNGWVDNNNIENDELLEFYYQNEGIQSSIGIARRLSSEGLLSMRWSAAMHYICSRKSKSDADTFFETLASGIGLVSADDVIAKLRRKLMQNAIKNGNKREPEVYMAAYTIQGWNSFRTGNKRDLFRWRGQQKPNEAFPRAK